MGLSASGDLAPLKLYQRKWESSRREVHEVNHKRVYRLYREEGLIAVRKRRRKRVSRAG